MVTKAPEIVLTGGPCGGKTTALAFLSDELGKRGFRVLINPEVATLLITNGLQDIGQIAATNMPIFLELERQFLQTELDLRARFQAFGQILASGLGDRCVIISDRGAMDVAAYVPAGAFEAVIDQMGLHLHDVRDSYTAIFHLITAANGAEENYNLDNKARKETPEQARVLDIRTQHAWVGHEHFRIIDNSTDFKEKLQRLLTGILKELGIPAPLEIERKFLVTLPDFSHPGLASARAAEIEQMFLQQQANGTQLRIRKKTQKGSATYYLTSKRPISARVREEREDFIDALDYFHRTSQIIPTSRIIRKQRHYFVYNNQYFCLDVIDEPIRLCLLEIELESADDPIDLPPFIKVEAEVTDDERFTNFGIACGKLEF